jgi:hypothetical protein
MYLVLNSVERDDNGKRKIENGKKKVAQSCYHNLMQKVKKNMKAVEEEQKEEEVIKEKDIAEENKKI